MSGPDWTAGGLWASYVAALVLRGSAFHSALRSRGLHALVKSFDPLLPSFFISLHVFSNQFSPFKVASKRVYLYSLF